MSRGEDRRQAREAQSDMKKFYYIFGAVAVLGIGVVGWQVSSGVLSTAAIAPVDLGPMSDEELFALAQGNTVGEESAAVTIVEFGDYQCPGCGAFALSVKPQVDQLLVGTGRAKFVFYDFPLVSIHGNAFFAARASRCAADQGQEKYWAYHEMLFRQQARWSAASMPASAFEQYASDVGLDEGAFGSCLNSDAYADVVTANMQLGQRMGVRSTPTILINAGGTTRQLSSVDFQTLSSTIDELTGAGSN